MNLSKQVIRSALCAILLATPNIVRAQGGPTDTTNYPVIVGLTLTNDHSALKFLGLSGYSYVVKATTNLLTWESIGNVGFVFTGEWVLGYLLFEDTDAKQFPSRFYTVATGTNMPIQIALDQPTPGLYMFGVPIYFTSTVSDPAGVSANISYWISIAGQFPISDWKI